MHTLWNVHVTYNIIMTFPINLTLIDFFASSTAFLMKSSVILRDGCSLKTEFINAILAALLLASALVGQFCQHRKI